MFILKWTHEARTQYDALRRRATSSLASRQKNQKTKAVPDEGLFKQVHKCVTLLSENPRHPGFQTRQYHGMEHPFDPAGKVFEAYLQNRTPGVYRVFWCYGPAAQDLTIITITRHT